MQGLNSSGHGAFVEFLMWYTVAPACMLRHFSRNIRVNIRN